MAPQACTPIQEGSHKKLVEKLKEKFGTFPAKGGYIEDALVCSDETVAREAIDLLGGTIGITRNVGFLEIEGEVKTSSEKREDVKKQVEAIETPGAWKIMAHPCKVVEEHEHEETWHEHFKCAAFMMSPDIAEKIVLELAKIIKEKAEW